MPRTTGAISIRPSSPLPSPDLPGVELGRSADGFRVARIDDIVLAMISITGGGYRLSSSCTVRAIEDLRERDFFCHEGHLDDEAGFFRRVAEIAEHRRELAALARQQTEIATQTPWGPSQGATVYEDGVVCHSTASHGGFHLSPCRNREVARSVRNALGWYEEDCEWALVALTFPHLFTGYERRCADTTIRHSWPDLWEKKHGRQLGLGQSQSRDRLDFDREHAHDWVVISAIRSSHHTDMTEVIATMGGRRSSGTEERRFLVSHLQYDQRGPFGFVIDTALHQIYDGPSSFVGWKGAR